MESTYSIPYPILLTFFVVCFPLQMGYQLGKSAPSLLRMNYEKYLYPYDIFQAGAFTGDPQPGVSKQHEIREIREILSNFSDYLQLVFSILIFQV